VAQARVERYLVEPLVTPVEETGRRKINTRQFARLKKLQALVPGCVVDDSSNRMLTYPLNREADVLSFLESCPKGSKKEAKNLVYTAMDPTAKPGLKAAKRKQVKVEVEGKTPHDRIVIAAKKVLTDNPLGFEELYLQLKARDRIPKGFNPRPILKRILRMSGLFDLSSSDVYSIREEPAEEPESSVEPPPVSEPVLVVSSELETVSPKVPAFFPRWAES
jgi:hypothetical protein